MKDIFFPAKTNMIDIKGKIKVLTSARASESKLVDPDVQISADEYKREIDEKTSQRFRYQHPWVTSHVLLKKYQ